MEDDLVDDDVVVYAAAPLEGYTKVAVPADATGDASSVFIFACQLFACFARPTSLLERME